MWCMCLHVYVCLHVFVCLPEALKMRKCACVKRRESRITPIYVCVQEVLKSSKHSCMASELGWCVCTFLVCNTGLYSTSLSFLSSLEMMISPWKWNHHKGYVLPRHFKVSICQWLVTRSRLFFSPHLGLRVRERGNDRRRHGGQRHPSLAR